VVINSLITARNDLTTLFGAGAIGRLSDAELIRRFVEGRGSAESEAAFEIIVARHGPMVLGVCRRALCDAHAAEDAFQATFLILARKARSVRVGDSLGRWLYGVSMRVARRARAVSRTERVRVQELHGFDPPAAADWQERVPYDELRVVIDEEIARLPDRYRRAVVLCYLEGLTQEQVARRLRCPLGTVQSRLHRARERLRTQLSRRGLATAAWSSETLAGVVSRPEVPPNLVVATVSAAVRLGTGGVVAGLVPAAIAALASETLRAMMIADLSKVGLLLAVLGLTAVGAGTRSLGGNDKVQTLPRAAEAAKTPIGAARSDPTLAEQFATIQADYDAKLKALTRAQESAKNHRERSEIVGKMSPDEVAFARRMVELAASSPKDPVARDASIWVIDKPFMSDGGAYGDDRGTYGDEFARAAALLVRNHGDDPVAVSVGLGLSNILTYRRDTLLLGFYAAAKGREAKGLARLALADYLERKAESAAGVRKVTGRQKQRFIGVIDENGKLFDKEVEQSDEDYAYVVHLRLCDPNLIRAEAERLYEEVVAEYGDVPYSTFRHRNMEALLRDPAPKSNGKPLSDTDRRKLEGLLARKRTLGQVAEAHLDKMHNLVVGKPAPEIDGVDFDGKPLKLSGYRGKIVVLVFWGSWCGPCMREVPHERELVERLKRKPFAILGVDCDEEKQAAIKAIQDERITWPNWHDGAPGTGPIASRYHIRSYPTVLVLDARGIIRHKQALGTGLDSAVDELLKELESKGGRK
jgi:RNA polymerase sigma factor (sigma-70 family)